MLSKDGLSRKKREGSQKWKDEEETKLEMKDFSAKIANEDLKKAPPRNFQIFGNS